jgi:hypothetical protein
MAKTEETSEPGQTLSRVIALRDTYVTPQLEWYRTKKTLPRVLYRSSGIITVVLSTAIPVLAQSKWFGDARDNVLSGMGLVVAIVTSLSAFMGWDRVWRGRRQTESVLEHLLATWDLEILRANTLLSGADADRHCLQATKELLASVHTVTLSEAEQFFDGLKPVGSMLASAAPPNSETKTIPA